MNFLLELVKRPVSVLLSGKSPKLKVNDGEVNTFADLKKHWK